LTILNESGTPDVVSPLWGLSPLAERLPDAIFVLVGTRADAYTALSLCGPLPGSRQTRHAAGAVPPFVLLEPDSEPEGGALASRVVEAAAGSGGAPEVVLIVACRSAGLLGVDAAFEAELAERRLGVPVRAVETSGDAKNPLATDLEDAVAQTLVGLSPREARAVEKEEPAGKGGLLNRLRGRATGRASFGDRGTPRPVVLLGGLEASREELADELGRTGVEVVGGVPDSVRNLPEIGEGTVVAPVDPYLARAARAAEERGATVVRTLLPVGVDGTARFVQDVAGAAGRVTGEAGRAREVWSSMEYLRGRIRGKRVFFTGDTGLEVPLARFLANAGAVVVEVGTPRLERRFLAAELGALGSDVDVVESPEWRAQLGRVEETRPDVVVASPGLYAPLVARGHLCRSSLDLLSLDPRGYEGARRVLALLARTFERAEELDALNL